MIPISQYLWLGMILFTIGVIGVVTRRNVIIILMSIELMLNAVNINLVAFSRLVGSAEGHAFAIFIITDAAAEAAVGLGIIIAFFRNRETLLGDEMDLLKWLRGIDLKCRGTTCRAPTMKWHRQLISRS
jgi:NADH-quinone oxidoreductase subunit K